MSRNHDLKEESIYKIRSCFYQEENWTKNRLAKMTNQSLASTTNVLQILMQDKEILYMGDAESTGGRKSKKYTLNPEYVHMGFVILRKEGPNYILHVYSSNMRNNVIVDYVQEKISVTLEDIKILCTRLCELDKRIEFLVVSIPGVCENGIIEACDYRCLENVNLRKELEEVVDKEIIIENDVNIACIGFSNRYPSICGLVFIYQPEEDYVGVGMVLNHHLYNGFSHFAGELRYCPFYTHEEQEQMIKENPKDLLMKQIGMLCTVVNPEIVGYHSDCFEVLDMDLKQYGIPEKHCPKLIQIEDFEKELKMGLYSIGLNYLKENRRKENEN